MADTESSPPDRTVINLEVPDPREAVTWVKRWLLANKTVHDPYRNPVLVNGSYRRVHPEQTARVGRAVIENAIGALTTRASYQPRIH